MHSLIVINDAPYGTERFYNAIRLAHALLKQDRAKVDLFFEGTSRSNMSELADATVAADRALVF